MKIQLLTHLVLLFSANLALALPAFDTNLSATEHQNADCSGKPKLKSLRDIFHRTNVIGPDDRKPLSQNLIMVGFSEAEQEQAMRCTGHIYCPEGEKGPSMQSAGAICGPNQRTSTGQCKADRLGTVGHIFVNKTTNQFYPRVNECEFRNYRGHSSKLVINDLKVIDPKIDSNNPHKNMRADKVVVRLKKPIPGCDPYELDSSDTAPAVGSELIALTHLQKDQGNTYDGSEPMAYTCFVTKTFPVRGGGPSMFYSDCDANGIGSGGFTLGRNPQNKLAVSGLFLGSGSPSKNGDPYDEEKKSFTISVGVNADFIGIANNPGVKPEPQLSQGLVPTLRPTSGSGR